MSKQYTVTRKTVFWIASILSVLLLAIYVLASTHVTHYDTTDLGLLTKLPMAFCIGLSYLGVLLYVSRKSERRTVIVVALISFYLFGIPVLIKENKAEWLQLSYRLSSEGVDLLSIGNLALNTLDFWDFRSWPGFYFFTAFLSASTGLPATVLSDYIPLLTIALLGVITYSILRLQLNTLYSSFGALWFIGSFWTSQHYFCPQSFTYVISFAIILLLAKLFFTKKQSVTITFTIIFLFTATVVSHLLTAFIIMVSVAAIYASQRILALRFRAYKIPSFYSITICILLASLFLSYQLLVIQRSFSQIIMVLKEEITQGETHLSAISGPRIVGSTSFLLELVGDYSITIMNVVIAMFAILTTAIGLLFHKKETIHDVFWISWIIVAGIFGAFVYYGGEAIQRAYMFMLIPICYFSIKFLSKKPGILILILIMLTFINIPAQYSREMYLTVPTSEIKGLAFLVEYKSSTKPFFYSLPSGYKDIRGEQIFIYTKVITSRELVDKTVGEADIIISSDLQKNEFLYFLGVDPLEHINFDDHNNRIYDNEGFRVYTHDFLTNP
jgi:hypothetical protein